MKTWKKRLFMPLVLLGVMSLLAAACGGDDDDDSTTADAPAGDAGAGETYKIGGSFCLSGFAAQVGEQMQRGMELSIAEVNARSDYKLEAEVVDSKADPALSTTVQSEFADSGVVASLHCGTSATVAAVPISERNEILMVSAGAIAPNLLGISDWFRNPWINTQLQQDILVDVFADEGIENVAIVAANNAYGLGTIDYVKELWPEHDIEILEVIEHEEGASTHAPGIARMRALDPQPDGIMLITSSNDAALFMSQARDAGIEVPFFSDSGVESQPVLDVGEASDGLRYTTSGFDYESDDPRIQAYIAAHEEETGNREPQVFETGAYQAIQLISQAIDDILASGGEVTGKTLRDTFDEMEFDGMGFKLSFEEGGAARVPVALKVVEDGAFKTLEIINP